MKNRWYKDEEEWLSSNYYKYSLSELCRYLGKSEQRIMNYFSLLNIHPISNPLVIKEVLIRYYVEKLPLSKIRHDIWYLSPITIGHIVHNKVKKHKTQIETLIKEIKAEENNTIASTTNLG